MPPSEIEPHLFIIFGATGDLAHRKLLPALYQVTKKGILDDNFKILCVARTADLNDETFRDKASSSLIKWVIRKMIHIKWCEKNIFYLSNAQSTKEDFDFLSSHIQSLEKSFNLGFENPNFFISPCTPAGFSSAN